MIWNEYGPMLGGTEPTTQSLITVLASEMTLYDSIPGFNVGLVGRAGVVDAAGFWRGPKLLNTPCRFGLTAGASATAAPAAPLTVIVSVRVNVSPFGPPATCSVYVVV